MHDERAGATPDAPAAMPARQAATGDTAGAGEAGAGGGRLPGVDGVRGLAALGVVLVHVGLISGYNMRPGSALGPYLARGEAGVSVFFVVSGFLIYRPFVAASLAGRPSPRLVPYLGRRLVRIVPLYWLVLTVVLFVDHRSPVDGVGDLVTYYGFVQIYRPGFETGGVQQAWSLCTIVSFYLVAPVLAAAVRATCDRVRASAAARVAAELGVIATLFVGGYAYRWAVVSDYALDPLSADGRILWLPTSADVFAVGMALAVLHAWGERRPGGLAALVRGLGRVPAGAWWALAGLCYWAVSTRVGLPRSVGAVGHRQWMLREVLYTGVALFLLLPALFGPQDRGLVRRLLRSPPMAALGALSFGIFLWHEWVLDVYREQREIVAFSGWFPGMLVATLVGSTALAAVTWFAVERPAQALAARWSTAERPLPPTPQQGPEAQPESTPAPSARHSGPEHASEPAAR
jgi:peptidoglycan/LPS O-acetylase OafA/YrhL